MLGGGGGVCNIRAFFLLQSVLRMGRREEIKNISVIKMFLNIAHGYIQESGCQELVFSDAY